MAAVLVRKCKEQGVARCWYTASLGLSLGYDVMYDKLNVYQRRFIRSAIAISVKYQWSWGLKDGSDRHSPDVIESPHRIFSN